MNRKQFISSIALAALSLQLPSCSYKKKIGGRVVGASAKTGHLLRDRKFGPPSVVKNHDIVIIGAGVSGLSAARRLNQEGLHDFVVLDLEQHTGGNSAFGKNEISAFPWGAHYVPIPNNSLTEYLSFLQDSGVITGYENGLPVYNEYHLCFDPQERLYINGRWQEGLIPQFGLPEKDLQEVRRFLELMDNFRHLKGSDGRDAFAIPVDESSKDEEYMALDRITMKQWLASNQFQSHYLHQYVNYCTRDDFGTRHDQVSAWAGIHYFAGRKGMAVNALHDDVLTWPEGNGFLIQQLEKNIRNRIITGALAISVQEEKDQVAVRYLDIAKDQIIEIRTRQCLMALPQFVAGRLLGDQQRIQIVKDHFNYTPWMVANLVTRIPEERSGAPMSWDNVLFESEALGYVDATHELVSQNTGRKNLTYYLPLTRQEPAEERKKAQQKIHEEWVEQVIDDLRKVHPDLEKKLEEVNVMVWGHAMVQPRPGLIYGPVRGQLAESQSNRIHFAHTDLAGISIFEEGFYQGLRAASKMIVQLT